jgi:hypothetical protein
MRFVVNASVANADVALDAAFDFGAGSVKAAHFWGSPDEIGAEVARFLSSLTPGDCEAMKYGTSRFFLELTIEPEALPSRKWVQPKSLHDHHARSDGHLRQEIGA